MIELIKALLDASDDKKEIAFLKAYEKVTKLKAPAPWDYASIEGKHGFTLLALKKKYKICDIITPVTSPKKKAVKKKAKPKLSKK